MDNKKDEIISTTIGLYDKKGDKITLRDISESVSCSHTLVLKYFENLDGLMSACFDEVCHRIKLNLLRVPYPDKYSEGTVERYFLDMWETYLEYLQEHSVESHFYFAMLLKGYQYPKGYTLPTQILRSILKSRYDEIVSGNPDILFVAIYIISATNGFVQSIINGDFDGYDNLIPRLRSFMVNGICGGLQKNL